jgi:acylphosphatase
MSRPLSLLLSLPLAFLVAAPAPAEDAPAKSDAPPSAADVRRAVEPSLVFLTEDGSNWMATRKCASCHAVPMTIWSLREAKDGGFKIDEKTLAELRAQALKSYVDHPKHKPVGQDGTGDGLSRATTFLTLAAASPSPDRDTAEALAKFAAHFLATQQKDGSWTAGYGQPPVNDTSDVTTLWVLLAELAAQTDANKEAMAKSRERALAWLKEKGSGSHQALALQTLLSARLGKPDEALVKQLRERQNADGGWSQVKDAPSDAFATGQSLYALAAAGVAPGDAAVRQAQAFLLTTQKKDGSWPVKTRVAKGGNVIISYTGTAWATLGLVRTLPAETGEPTMTGRMVYYSGRVQGVGFRATTAGLARGRPVTGWVRNLADGRVQLLAEGAEKDVEAFLQAVREHWKGYVEKEQIEKQAATGKLKGFEIVR